MTSIDEMKPDFLVGLIKDARRAYFDGNYDDALKLSTQVLAADPQYEDARILLEKIELSIRNGEISQSKIPEQARSEFSVALSLERAGRFDEARERYQLAQVAFMASVKSEEKKPWPAAADAIQRIDRYLFADKLCSDAAKFADEDLWNDAIVAYSMALIEFGDNFKSSIVSWKIEELQESQSKFVEVENVFSEKLMVNPLGTAGKLNLAIKVVSGQINRFPKSKKWKDAEKKLYLKISGLRKIIFDRKKFLVSALAGVSTIVDAKSYIDELVELLRVASETWDDEEFYQLSLHYESQGKIIQKHWNDFQWAQNALGDSDKTYEFLMGIKAKLTGLQQYSMDFEYVNAVHELKNQIFQLASKCWDDGQKQTANKLWNSLKGDPFDLIDDKSKYLEWLEVQVNRDKSNVGLYSWYQNEKLKYEYDVLYKETISFYDEMHEDNKFYYRKTIGRHVLYSMVWFVGCISAAIVFSGVLVYAILITINEDNPLTLILPALSSALPFYVSKVLYTQSVAENDRIKDLKISEESRIKEIKNEKNDQLNEILEKKRRAIEKLDKDEKEDGV